MARAAIAREAMLRRQGLQVRRTELARRRACDCRTRCYQGGHPCGGTSLRSVYREERVLGWIDVAETAIGRGFVLDWQRFVEES